MEDLADNLGEQTHSKLSPGFWKRISQQVQSFANVRLTIGQGTKAVMSQSDPAVPACPADLTFARNRAHLWTRQFLIQLKSLAEKLDRFLVCVILHGLFASLIKILYRLEQSLIIPLRLSRLGGLRPMMSQKNVIALKILFVVLL